MIKESQNNNLMIENKIKELNQNQEMSLNEISNKLEDYKKQQIIINESNPSLDKKEQKESNIKFDIIVSNPPYIATSEIKTLPKDVRQEPIIALDGGKDGLEFYRKIYEKGYEFLNRHGFLCVEIGYNQKEAVKKIIEQQKRYVETYCKKDLCENDRVVVTKIT